MAIECDDGDDIFFSEPLAPDLSIYDSPPEYSGLLDEEGNPLYRPKNKIGFI